MQGQHACWDSLWTNGRLATMRTTGRPYGAAVTVGDDDLRRWVLTLADRKSVV